MFSLRQLAVPVLLVVATLLVYGQVIEFEFTNFDDNLYVTDNPQVKAGVGAAGIRWAFTTGHASNWHPITWFSHMVDWELFGADPAGHHATNLLLHLVNTLLVFLFFQRTTGREGASAWVAMLFAVHPLHVESVAWVSERKDLLSGFFALLCIHAWVSYAKDERFRSYLLVAALLAMGLMAKPMLVTLPFVLLLLDYWPLKRFGESAGLAARETFRRLSVEKLPLLLLSIVSSVTTLLVQRSGGAMGIGYEIPIHLRLANAVVSYVRYLGKTFWPGELSLLYPHPYAPGGLPWSSLQVAMAALVLVGITVAVVYMRSHRHLIVGWLWFVGMLFPVIGVVQVGGQAMADRYTYLPLIGVFAAIAFAGDRALVGFKARPGILRPVTIVLACTSVVASVLVARAQASVWHDSLSLLGHASRVTPGNPIILNHYGHALQVRGRYQEAARYYRRSLQFQPDNPKTHSNLGRAIQLSGSLHEAIAHYRRAIELSPDYAHAWINLGNAVGSLGKLSEATSYYEKAIESDPASIEARFNLATTYRSQGSCDKATEEYRNVLELDPRSAHAELGVGLCLLASNRAEEAIFHFERALELKPDFEEARKRLAEATRTRGRKR